MNPARILVTYDSVLVMNQSSRNLCRKCMLCCVPLMRYESLLETFVTLLVTSLVPSPFIQRVDIASYLSPCAILKATCAGFGLCLGQRLASSQVPPPAFDYMQATKSWAWDWERG